jgi:hypothetical protein
VVEELDVVPGEFLLARGVCGDLLSAKCFWFGRRGLQREVFDLELARADVFFD